MPDLGAPGSTGGPAARAVAPALLTALAPGGTGAREARLSPRGPRTPLRTPPVARGAARAALSALAATTLGGGAAPGRRTGR